MGLKTLESGGESRRKKKTANPPNTISRDQRNDAEDLEKGRLSLGEKSIFFGEISWNKEGHDQEK